MSNIVVGVLDTPSVGFVGPTGAVELPGHDVTIEWAYYTDAWHEPSARSARQTALEGMPVVETRVAVPSGDVVHRVYAIAGATPAVVIELENASPAPLAVSLTVPEQLVAAAPAWREVEARGSSSALIWPLPHRARVRAVVPPLDPRACPAADEVVRGWHALLERGARLVIDDDATQRAVDGARAALLLCAGRDRPRPTASDVIALEDWGFDAEAVAAWGRLSIRERRLAGRREPIDDVWSRVRAGLADAPGGVPAAPASFLRAVHDVVLTESRSADRTVAVFPNFPAEWLGRAVALHDAPTRHGVVSCAVRWHGARPALIWTAPEDVTLTAPALDPSWSSDAREGEALLASPPDQLLRLATEPRRGDSIEEPGSFT